MILGLDQYRGDIANINDQLFCQISIAKRQYSIRVVGVEGLIGKPINK
jgi:hypothetical protein